MLKLLSLILFLTCALPANAEQQVPLAKVIAAAENGKAEMQNVLGLAYTNGDQGVFKNSAEALKWFTKAANEGYPPAMFNLGVLYRSGFGVPVDPQKADEWNQKAANAGNLDAVFTIGTNYQAQLDFPHAAKYFTIAAEKGFLPAQNRIAYFYSNGLGVPKDDKIAHSWYLKAANAGMAKAQDNVAQNYFFGVGVKKNIPTAITWFKKSAEQGYAQAQTRLIAISYDNGDKKQTAYWLQKAAENDDNLKNLLSEFYHEEPQAFGTPTDPTQALAWYIPKANEGDRDAQFELGLLYLKAGNEPEGVKWVESAGGKGQPLALRMIEINKGYHGTNEYINAYKDKLKTEFEQNRTQIKSGIQGMLTR